MKIKNLYMILFVTAIIAVTTVNVMAETDSETQSLFNLINSYRADNNLGPLNNDILLQNSANWMSDDMSNCVEGGCTHTDSEGRNLNQRLKDFGYPVSSTSIGENIAWGLNGIAATAQQVFEIWKNSPDDKTNLLNSSYKVIGISRSCINLDCAWVIDFGGTNSEDKANWSRLDEHNFHNVDSQYPGYGFPYLFNFESSLYNFYNGSIYKFEYKPFIEWQKLNIPIDIDFHNHPIPSIIGNVLYLYNDDQLWYIKEHESFSTDWKKVISTGIPIGSQIIPMTLFNGQLYAAVYPKDFYPLGVGEFNSGSTFDIYRSPDFGKPEMTWTKVVSNGFGNTHNHGLGEIIEYNKKLVVVTTDNRESVFGAESGYGPGIEVWESPSGDDGDWHQINIDGFGTELTLEGSTFRTNQDFGSAAIYNGYLYIGTNAHYGGQVWRYDGSGLNGWTNVTPPWMGPGQGPSRAFAMTIFQNYLYMGEGRETANLDKYDGRDWQIVVSGSDFRFGTSPIGHPFDPVNLGIYSLATVNDKIYAATSPQAFDDSGDEWQYPLINDSQIWGYPFATSLSGTKFNDINGNGIKEEEPGLQNWQIDLIYTNGTVYNTTITDKNGNYNFSGINPGNYILQEVLQPGWVQTSPVLNGSSTYIINISLGDNFIDKNFGNFKLGEVHGQKFEDLNANGIKDANEIGLAGWEINIKGKDTIDNMDVNQSTTTDADGKYNFTGLTAGTYTISETLKPGWIQTAPSTGTYSVNITSGSNITAQDFGNFHKGNITGGGWTNITGDPMATFGIVGQYPDSSNTAQGNVEYHDHMANLNIKSVQINTVATTLDKKEGAITGLAQVNGTGNYPFEIYVEDNGEPGKGIDVFRINLPTYPYSNGAILSGGNIQIHS